MQHWYGWYGWLEFGVLAVFAALSLLDHLSGEPEDRPFSRAAHAMRREDWWLRRPVIVVPGDVAGEVVVP